MPDTGKKIIETLEKVIPEMTENEKIQLLSFGEGVAFMKSVQKEQSKETEKVS